MNAKISFQAEGGMLTFVDVGVVDTRVVIGLERVEAGVFVVSSEGRVVEWFEAGANVECFTEWGVVGVLCQCEEERGVPLDRGTALSFSCASLVLFQYAWISSAAWIFVAGSHVLSASGYPFHLMRNWSFLLRPK
jgi:hypothetical protein